MTNWKRLRFRLGIIMLISAAFVLFAYFAFIGPLVALNRAAGYAEISKIAGLLVTVEGILMALSPLFFDKLEPENRWWAATAVTLTAIALLTSLSAIALADTNAITDVVVIAFGLNILFFGGVTLMYVLMVWEVSWNRKR